MKHSPTLEQIAALERDVRLRLEAKRYQDVNFEITFRPVNDEVHFKLFFYNTEWSSTYMPRELRKYGLSTVHTAHDVITGWVISLPNEHEAREQALLRDYAAVKERIAASNLSDLIKAESEVLMKMLSTNILEVM